MALSNEPESDFIMSATRTPDPVRFSGIDSCTSVRRRRREDDRFEIPSAGNFPGFHGKDFYRFWGVKNFFQFRFEIPGFSGIRDVHAGDCGQRAVVATVPENAAADFTANFYQFDQTFYECGQFGLIGTSIAAVFIDILAQV